MDRLTTKQYWDNEWKNDLYQARVFNSRKCSNFAFDLIFKEFLPKGALRALEIGAGASIWLAYLDEFFGYTVYGLDYSVAGCLSANLNYTTATGEPPRIVQGDIFQCPFKEQSFDVVYSLGVIEHFSNPMQILKIAKRLLKPGGILLTAVPNKAGIAGWTERWLNHDNYWRHNPLTKYDLEYLYKAMGLSQVQVRYFGYISVIGKLPSRSLGPTLRLLGNLNKALTYYLIYPLYMKTNIRPNHRTVSSFIVACGERMSESG